MRLEWGQPSETVPLHEGVPESPQENGMMQQEMDEFQQYALEQKNEAIELSEGGFNEQGRFIPSRVQEIDAEAAEYDPELRELSDELDSWIEQGEQMSCAVASQTMAINQLTNEHYSEQELLDIAKEKGWYQEGTRTADVGKIAEYLGLEVEQRHDVAASELTLANDPEVKVLANVDSTLLHFPESFKRCQPDHCVQVLRVERTAEGEMVILNDPGHENGRGAVYPMEIFEKAYQGDITTIRNGVKA